MGQPEAWLRGPVDGIDPLLMPAAHALTQAREDLATVARSTPQELLWARPGGAASVGFHIRHAGGATRRLLAYARGEALDEAELAAARSEKDDAPELDAAGLIADLERSLAAALQQLRATPRESLLLPREVGRARLPSNVLGLIFHAAEHAQRHAGQAIATARILTGDAP